MDKSTLLETKAMIITEAIDNGDIDKLNEAGFFKNISQIQKSGKIRTHNRIWLGRMLKMIYGRRAPNPGGIAIFQKPDEFKDIRKWEQNNK